MKKLLALLLCATLTFGLVGCGGGSDEGNSGTNTNTKTGSIAAKTGGYVYDANGTEIAIDAEAQAIVDALGDPISYFESASCAFEGLDKTYTYDGFTVTTYPDDEKVDRISDITINDDTVATKEGARLGMEASEIEGIYGTDYEDSNGSYLYKKGDMKLLFVITDGKVTSIQYTTTVLD